MPAIPWIQVRVFQIFQMGFKHYTQYDGMDCGPACLRMILRYYGRTIEQGIIRNMCEINKQGVNLLGINDVARSFGFETDTIQLKLNQFTKISLPAILHWDQNHFVVLYKIKKNNYFIADPAKGKITLSETAFKEHWAINTDNINPEGIALILLPSDAFITVKELNNISKKYLSNEENIPKGKNIANYLQGHTRSISIVLITLLVTAVIQFALPYITKNVVDQGIKNKDINFLLIILIAQFCLLCGRLWMEFIRGLVLLKIGTAINMNILREFIIKLMNLPIAFFSAQTRGSVLQRMQDHSRIESFLTGSLMNIVFSGINFIVLSIVLASYNLNIFYVFMIAMILYSYWITIFISKRRQLDYERFDCSAQEQNASIQLLDGIQEIKLFGMEKVIESNWNIVQLKLFKINTKIFKLGQWQQTGSLVINEIKNIAVIFLTATLVINGTISLGTMMAIQLILGQLNSPIEQFMSFFQNWQNANISMHRFNEIHRLKDEKSITSQASKVSKNHQVQLHGGKNVDTIIPTWGNELFLSNEFYSKSLNSSLSFHNISFTYPGAGNSPVLTGLSFDIPLGKTTAIVGMSGSGKTTILKLLLKYFEPQDGYISLPGTPLPNIDHHLWRSKCGVVMQDTYIFSDSIAKNIALGNNEINHDLLMMSCKLANIYDYVSELPLGFNTKIGDEGHELSMGQRQRILIARAIYRDPEFIFFDEATNSLDSNNEKEIQDKLFDFFLNKTVVIIAHRLSTIKQADQIIVLEKGCIIEKGTHIELLHLKGSYYDLVRNQID